MKLFHLIILCCAVALLTFGIVTIGAVLLTTDAVKFYHVKLITSNETVGVDVDNVTLDFGVVPVRGSSRREFIFTNNFDWNETVFFGIRGPVARFVPLANQSITLLPHETQHMFVTAYVPYNETLNVAYEGTFSIVYKRTLSSLIGG